MLTYNARTLIVRNFTIQRMSYVVEHADDLIAISKNCLHVLTSSMSYSCYVTYFDIVRILDFAYAAKHYFLYYMDHVNISKSVCQNEIYIINTQCTHNYVFF